MPRYHKPQRRSELTHWHPWHFVADNGQLANALRNVPIEALGLASAAQKATIAIMRLIVNSKRGI